MNDSEPSRVGGFRLGDWLVQPSLNRISRGDEEITLELKWMEVLVCLAERAGEMFSRQEIIDTVWATEFITDNTLTHTIAELRSALGDDANDPTYIETIRRRGYRLVAPVEWADAVGAEGADGRPAGRSKWPHVLAIGIAVVIGLLAVLPPESLFERGTGTTKTPVIRSIAILPLENLTGDPDQQYFVDGLHDELISTFARFSGLEKVTARTSVMGFKGSDTPIREIGGQLGIDGLLEGSVRRSGVTFRVSLKLLEAETEDHLWADTFDRDVADTLKVQTEIARAVAREVGLVLREEEERRLAGAQRVDERVISAYLRARYSNRLGLRERIALAEQAIDMDPSFAPAYVELSHLLRVSTLSFGSPSDVMPRAHVAVVKALTLDDSSDEAHAELGRLMTSWFRDWTGAESEFQRVLRSNPNCVPALEQYSKLLSYLGYFDEADDLMRRVVELDPLNPSAHSGLVWSFVLDDRLDEAIAYALDSLEVFPHDRDLQWLLCWAYSLSGDHDEAVAVWTAREEMLHLQQSVDPNRAWDVCSRAWILARAGRTVEAEHSLQRLLELSEHQYVAPSYIAVAKIALGDHDGGIEWLERAYAEHDRNLNPLKVDPDWDPVRGDPRFEAILAKMNFPED